MTRGSRSRVSPSTSIFGFSLICHFESIISEGTVIRNSNSTFPFRSATLRKRAVTKAAFNCSCATICPSTSLTALIISTSSPVLSSTTTRVSLDLTSWASSGRGSSPGREIDALEELILSLSAFLPVVAQPRSKARSRSGLNRETKDLEHIHQRKQCFVRKQE